MMTKLEIILITYIVLLNLLMVLIVFTSRKRTVLLTICAIIGFPLTTIILSIYELIDRIQNKKGDRKWKKAIGFRLNEQKKTKEVMIEDWICNGFGKIELLPPKIEKQVFSDNFDSNELGDIFVEMGYMLKRLGKDITNLELKSKFVDNPEDIGKTFMVELQFEEVGKWKRVNLLNI